MMDGSLVLLIYLRFSSNRPESKLVNLPSSLFISTTFTPLRFDEEIPLYLSRGKMERDATIKLQEGLKDERCLAPSESPSSLIFLPCLSLGQHLVATWSFYLGSCSVRGKVVAHRASESDDAKAIRRTHTTTSIITTITQHLLLFIWLRLLPSVSETD